MIIRTEKNRNYTAINNTILTDKRLSWAARGLAAFLLTKPDSWDINREYLADQGPDGVWAVRSALKELRTAGYITNERGQTTDGKFCWIVTLHEVTVENQPAPVKVKAGNQPSQRAKRGVVVENMPVENMPVENMPVENMPVENRRQVSTVVVSTEEVKTEVVKGRAVKISPPAQSAPPPAPAIAIYEEIFERKANSNQRKAITDTVTDCAKWREVLTTWALKGHSATNVVDQLDVYANGWQRKPYTNGNTPTPEPKTTRRLAQPIFAEE